MTVSISTTKGKKDRIALAATENAKVCTSVRMRYCTVESTRFGVRRAGGRDAAGGLAGARIVGFGTATLHPTLGGRDDADTRGMKVLVCSYLPIPLTLLKL